MISAQCSQLISCVKDYPITYARRLFNHLPMTLVALDEIGATSCQLQQFHQHYAQRLTFDQAKQLTNPLSQQFEVLQQQYLTELHQLGLEQTIKKALRHLFPGMLAGAFYGLTRLANALKTDNLEEISIALTCWHVHYLDVKGIKPLADKKPTNLLRNMAKVTVHYRFPAGNIVDRMESVLSLPYYHEIASQPKTISFDIVVAAVISTYYMTGDFTMHQCVVAVKALGELLPYYEEQELAVRYFWQASVIAYLSTGGIKMSPLEPVELIDWRDIKAFCCDCANEHLIQLCCACEQLYLQTGDINCHRVASRQVRLNS